MNVIIGFQRTEIAVSEDVGLEVVCAVIRSGPSLIRDAKVNVFSIDGTAMSCGPGRNTADRF